MIPVTENVINKLNLYKPGPKLNEDVSLSENVCGRGNT
jgi:hypothetical protein